MFLILSHTESVCKNERFVSVHQRRTTYLIGDARFISSETHDRASLHVGD